MPLAAAAAADVPSIDDKLGVAQRHRGGVGQGGRRRVDPVHVDGDLLRVKNETEAER